ncbi:hypothetical protein QBC41DRAFT_51140 [Cercophora samala]|uniref:Uncharacterized protein n=1 Tax=Cercophora samala TaxID=330535 RepID=A0AA39YU69_9PEZI|nr:hypothetical protein QBC41DRAFT_51140 [Cercophora samala]
MPRRRDFPQREENPNRRIHAWDDGYASHHPHSSSMPRQRSPSPRRSRPNRTTTSHYPPRTRQFSASPPPYREDDFHQSPRPRTGGGGGSGGANQDYFNDHPMNNPNPDDHHHRGRASHSNPQRPPLGRSKSTSAKEFLATGLKSVQHMSPRWQKAAQAAVQAGGLAAFQARKQPGDWVGAKGVKVATAAFTAGLASSKMHKERDGEGRDRGYERDSSRERSRGRDRDYERDRSRGRDRDYERDRERGGGRPTGQRRGSNLDAIGNMVGGFVAEQWAKRAQKERR